MANVDLTLNNNGSNLKEDGADRLNRDRIFKLGRAGLGFQTHSLYLTFHYLNNGLHKLQSVSENQCIISNIGISNK